MNQKCNSLVFVVVTNKYYNQQNQIVRKRFRRRFTTSTAINMLNGTFYWDGFHTALFGVFESIDKNGSSINNICANEQMELARTLSAIASQITTFENLYVYSTRSVSNYDPNSTLYPKLDTPDIQKYYQKINELRGIETTYVVGAGSPFKSLTHEQAINRQFIKGDNGGAVTCLNDILHHETIKHRLEKGQELAIFLNGTEVFSNIENWNNDITGKFNDVFIQENGLVRNAHKDAPVDIVNLNDLNVIGYHF